MKILIIGGGNMGMTFAHSFLKAHITTQEDLMILERSQDKINLLSEKIKCKLFYKAIDCVEQADMIVLAVKPQDSLQLFEQIRPYVDNQQIFISLMAGVKTSKIASALGISKIIRSMPNLPSQIGLGMTAFTSTDEITRIELITVQNLLNTTGKTLYVSDENLIDASTAISGSGPAYVFYFMQAMIDSAIKMGFQQSEAELLVAQTFKGAIDLYNQSDYSTEQWISKVASKGGTTEAAIKTFKGENLFDIISKGTFSALKRAEELGN